MLKNVGHHHCPTQFRNLRLHAISEDQIQTLPTKSNGTADDSHLEQEKLVEFIRPMAIESEKHSGAICSRP